MGTPRSFRTHASSVSATSLQVLIDDVLDMTLVPRLRPASLVVAAGHIGALVRDIDEGRAAQAEHLAALAPDCRDERPVTTDVRRQRSQVQLIGDLHVVGNAARQRASVLQKLSR